MNENKINPMFSAADIGPGCVMTIQRYADSKKIYLMAKVINHDSAAEPYDIVVVDQWNHARCFVSGINKRMQLPQGERITAVYGPSSGRENMFSEEDRELLWRRPKYASLPVDRIQAGNLLVMQDMKTGKPVCVNVWPTQASTGETRSVELCGFFKKELSEKLRPHQPGQRGVYTKWFYIEDLDPWLRLFHPHMHCMRVEAVYGCAAPHAALDASPVGRELIWQRRRTEEMV